MPLLSEIHFGSFLTYSPRGIGVPAERAKTWCNRIKSDQRLEIPKSPTTAEYLVEQLAWAFEHCPPLAEIIHDGAALVPAPSSSLLRPNGLWVPMRIAEAMANAGYGGEVLPCVRRAVAIRKAATSPSHMRPTAQEHYDSMAIEPQLRWPPHLVLVDDVITRGATLLGAASRLAEAAPESTIVAFAMMRTVSNAAEFIESRRPVVGTIRLTSSGGTHREP